MVSQQNEKSTQIHIDDDIQKADIISFNETKLTVHNVISLHMLGLSNEMKIFWVDRNELGEGVIL